MNGMVIFNHKLLVMMSRVVKRSSGKVGKDEAHRGEPVGKFYKTFAEVVANGGKVWQKKIKPVSGISKEQSVPSYEDLVSQIKGLCEAQQEQEKRIEDLVLMCLALKNELHHRLGLGGERREEEVEVEGEGEGGRNEEDDCNSKVAGSLFVDEVRNNSEEGVEVDEIVGVGSKGEARLEVLVEDGIVFKAGEKVVIDHRGEGGQTEGVSVDENILEEGELEDDVYKGEEGVLEEDVYKGEEGHVQKEAVAGSGRNFSNLHVTFLTKPTSLRFNHLGANSGISLLNKIKRRQAYEKGADSRVEQYSSSRTDSIEPDIGKEFTSKNSRELEARLRAEAEATLEVGSQVGVTFDSHRSSAIEKLMAMGV